MDTISVNTLRPEHIISIINISVNILIAVVIGIFINRNYTTIRAVKEYFITENQDIKNQYHSFLESIYKSQARPNEVQEWFKVMTMRIDIFEEFLRKEFRVHPKLSKHHNKIKILITGSDELNANYNSQTFSLLAESRIGLHKAHKDFTISQTKLVVDINKAKSK